jgi:Flp pilus assembly protein TadD
MVNAGLFYSEVHNDKKAEAAFEQAAALAPSDPKAYGYLATRVFAPRKDLKSAEATIDEGLKQGADPFALKLSLAEASEACGDMQAAEEALLTALKDEPYDFETIWRLGSIYMRENRYDQAALWMRKATEIRPDSAEAFYQLALAEDASFEYFEAGRDFRTALRLAPNNTEMRNRYEAFNAKLAAGRKDLSRADESAAVSARTRTDNSGKAASSGDVAPRSQP